MVFFESYFFIIIILYFFLIHAEKQICTPVAVANTANVEATPVFGPAGTYIPGSQVEFTASPGYHLCEGVTPLTEFTENCQYDRTFLENNPTRTVEGLPGFINIIEFLNIE